MALFGFGSGNGSRKLGWDKPNMDLGNLSAFKSRVLVTLGTNRLIPPNEEAKSARS